MIQSGTSPDDVARIFDVSRAIAYRWNQLYEKHGASALEMKKAPGRTPSLTLEQRGKIFALITGSNPAQMHLDFGELWTRKNVRVMIRREFGVKMSDVQVGRVLRDIGLSPQKPLYRSYKQNPERVEEWKRVIYPKIRSRALAEGAEISGLRTKLFPLFKRCVQGSAGARLRSFPVSVRVRVCVIPAGQDC